MRAGLTVYSDSLAALNSGSTKRLPPNAEPGLACASMSFAFFSTAALT